MKYINTNLQISIPEEELVVLDEATNILDKIADELNTASEQDNSLGMINDYCCSTLSYLWEFLQTYRDMA